MRLLALLVVCFAAQLTLAIAVVPPWQNPDEPQHLMTVRVIMAKGAAFTVLEDTDPQAESAILTSMARHLWWEHYGQPAPDPLPATFADGPARVIKDYFGPPGGGSRLYYRAVAALFAVTGIDGVVTQLYAMRLLAAVLSVMSLLCIWGATRAWLGDRAATVVGLLVALHPQFILASSTASPDAAVNLAGAAFWWAVVAGGSALAAGNAIGAARWAAAMWAAAAMAFLIRRMGAPLLLVAAGLTLVFIVRLAASRGSARTVVTAGAALAGAIVALTALSFWLVPDDVSSAGRWIQFDLAVALRTTIDRGDELPDFLRQFFESFWLYAGWLRYRAPAPWYVLACALTLAAAVGLAMAGRDKSRALVWTAVIIVALQGLAVVAYYFGILRAGPQGRYLFPVLPAMASLVWIGWRAWFRPEREQVAAVSLISVAAVLNLLAWTAVLLPTYLADAVPGEVL